MKLLLFFASSAISIFPLNTAPVRAGRTTAGGTRAVVVPAKNNNTLSFKDQSMIIKMPVALFKNQQFCSANVAKTTSETGSSIIGATVYFYGKGFHAVAKGVLRGSSLQPVNELMKLCKAGTIVSFDDIKIMGQDKQILNIADVSYLLF